MIHIRMNHTSVEVRTVYLFASPLIIHSHFVFHKAARKTDLVLMSYEVDNTLARWLK